MTVDLCTLKVGDLIKLRNTRILTVNDVKIHPIIVNHIKVTANQITDEVYSLTHVYGQNGIMHGASSSPEDIVEIIPVHITSSQITNDPTNPQHYVSESGKQLWNSMEEQFTHEEFIGYLKGNIWKYTQRYNKKNGLQDLKKAQVYLTKMIETLEKKK